MNANILPENKFFKILINVYLILKHHYNLKFNNDIQFFNSIYKVKREVVYMNFKKVI